MPNYDGTGPRGFGLMTGRGMGPCGRGFRRGFGYRRVITSSEEVSLLKEDRELLKKELEEINKRLKEIEK